MRMRALFNSFLPVRALRERLFAAARFTMPEVLDMRGRPTPTSALHAWARHAMCLLRAKPEASQQYLDHCRIVRLAVRRGLQAR